MTITATELANDSKGVIDRVLDRGETALIQRHGKSIVQIRRQVGVSKFEFIDRLKGAEFTEADRTELKAAMHAANQVFKNGHCD